MDRHQTHSYDRNNGLIQDNYIMYICYETHIQTYIHTYIHTHTHTHTPVVLPRLVFFSTSSTMLLSFLNLLHHVRNDSVVTDVPTSCLSCSVALSAFIHRIEVCVVISGREIVIDLRNVIYRSVNIESHAADDIWNEWDKL